MDLALLDKLPVSILKELCRSNGCCSSGRKSDLVYRLQILLPIQSPIDPDAEGAVAEQHVAAEQPVPQRSADSDDRAESPQSPQTVMKDTTNGPMPGLPYLLSWEAVSQECDDCKDDRDDRKRRRTLEDAQASSGYENLACECPT